MRLICPKMKIKAPKLYPPVLAVTLTRKSGSQGFGLWRLLKKKGVWLKASYLHLFWQRKAANLTPRQIVLDTVEYRDNVILFHGRVAVYNLRQSSPFPTTLVSLSVVIPSSSIFALMKNWWVSLKFPRSYPKFFVGQPNIRLRKFRRSLVIEKGK